MAAPEREAAGGAGGRARRAPWLVLAAAIAAVDLWSKQLWDYPGTERLQGPTDFPWIEKWVYVRTIWNEGGVWSISLPSWVLLAATVAAVPLLLCWLFLPRRTRRVESAAKMLILGGAIGNLVDRFKWGRVRDWIDVCFGDPAGWHYPTFNVADAALVIGIVLLLLLGFRREGASEEAS